MFYVKDRTMDNIQNYDMLMHHRQKSLDLVSIEVSLPEFCTADLLRANHGNSQVSFQDCIF
jgi:hypothetical protein